MMPSCSAMINQEAGLQEQGAGRATPDPLLGFCHNDLFQPSIRMRAPPGSWSRARSNPSFCRDIGVPQRHFLAHFSIQPPLQSKGGLARPAKGCQPSQFGGNVGRVEEWRGGLGVALRVDRPFRLPVPEYPTMLRFHSPLIEPYWRISRIRLSDKMAHAFAHER
jgi:hypothetical protein